ncbi:glycoside hydrolase family 5 protein [Pseudoxanthomonas sp. JBR18]|uniref:glycoside hydrolase family 5 protein n=1 Tax=Pseudoxanthomonas sp. JBR18 TaxID=2969308 RepID=UPI002305ABEE|nr:glycoside hydrolase family 5 protein [Pseudoxanthomonas sp. JBR18]WCE05931.1 glycoside hydrolase family 5 protein [Pseudoxanthomonas sp. JBR18]
MRLLPPLAASAALLIALLTHAHPASATDVLKYAGVNLAGAEFNSSAKPGVLYQNYVYPSDADFAYYASQGMNVVRLPFLWERLQSSAGATLDVTQLSYIRTAVTRAKNHGITVILDPHNYAKYYGTRIGTSSVPNTVFADLWRQLSKEFANDRAVIFGLMNEPYGVDAVTWAASAQAGIDAIRATGARNLILVPGVAWTGAHSWTNASAGGGTSNADALLTITDSANNIAFEVHQYMDSDYSGTHSTCVSTSIGADKLAAFTSWLRTNRRTGFLGEFGAAANETCLSALDNMLAYVQDNADVWRGWSYWAGGAWWGNYMFSVQPASDGSAKPQMTVLSNRAKRITTGTASPPPASSNPPSNPAASSPVSPMLSLPVKARKL